MSEILLYSTNTFLKWYVQEEYRGGVHYVCCSENFDSQTLSRYSSGALVPPSSNPAEIHRRLKLDVKNRDSHSYKINEQKFVLMKLAADWAANGEITDAQKDEIIFSTQNASFEQWRPLIYVIPRLPVAARLKPVPLASRAGLGKEFIIEDLKNTEFDIMEI